MTDWVWYAGYGSNLSQDRFSCYLEGGTPAGAGRSYSGCRDRSPAREIVPLRLRGRLAFRGESLVWGGGLAFLDPEPDDEVVARGYLITTDQLADVAQEERKYDERPVVGQRDGVPVVAFTSTRQHAPAAPSAAYLRTLLSGLVDGLLDLDKAVTYLLAAPGVGLSWDEESIAALLEQPQAARG